MNSTRGGGQPLLEAAGIEAAPGGAKLPAESRPYLATARNAWESSSRRVPSCPAPFRPIPHAPATYVQHGEGCPPLAARPYRAVWLAAPRGRPERATRSRCRVPVPELLRQGASDLMAARAQPGQCRGGQSSSERPGYPAPLQSLASGPCSGTVRERAPTDTATALGALHRPGLRLPRAAPLARSFVAVGASWHTPQRARLERAPSLDERT